jgi:hypothetical protein
VEGAGGIPGGTAEDAGGIPGAWSRAPAGARWHGGGRRRDPGARAEVAGRSPGRGGGCRRERGGAAAEDQEAIAAEESIEVGKNRGGYVSWNGRYYESGLFFTGSGRI